MLARSTQCVSAYGVCWRAVHTVCVLARMACVGAYVCVCYTRCVRVLARITQCVLACVCTYVSAHVCVCVYLSPLALARALSLTPSPHTHTHTHTLTHQSQEEFLAEAAVLKKLRHKNLLQVTFNMCI